MHVTAAPDAGPGPGSGQNTGITGTRHTVVDADQRQTAHTNTEIASPRAASTGVIEGTVITGTPADARSAAAPAGHDTGSHDTGSHDTGSHDTGSHDTGSHDTGGSYDETSGVVYEVTPSGGFAALGLEPDPEPADASGTSSPSGGTAETPATQTPVTLPIAISGLGQSRTLPQGDAAAQPAWNKTTASVHGAEEETRDGPLATLRGLFFGSDGDAAGHDGDRPPLNRMRDLPLDQKLRIWRTRALIVVLVGVVFSVISDWQAGLTLAIVAGIADTIYRARTVEPQPWGQPGTADRASSRAQRRTQRQLARMKRAGYVSLHRRPIPDSPEFIDHLVIGPTGVYAIDSEKWDRELPIRTRNARQLWLGPQSMKDRLEHARWEAAQASELLSRAMGSEIVVRPALAIYGPKVPWDIAVIREVDVFSGDRLKKYLRRRARDRKLQRLDAEKIARIHKAAAAVLPLAAGKATAPVG